VGFLFFVESERGERGKGKNASHQGLCTYKYFFFVAHLFLLLLFAVGL
jgi:hypothetical protein